MLTYIIQLTLIWSILLLLFEFFYKRTPYYTANRIYLISAMLLGIFLPLISISLPGSANTTPGRVLNVIQDGVEYAGNTLNAPEAAGNNKAFSYDQWLYAIYGAGAVFMLLLSIKEIVLILRKAIYGKYQLAEGRKIFSTGKIHAPFSFMGWVFISDVSHYEKEDLSYILKHESAHNKRRHWLDVIIMQLITIVFWFHPLVWYFRHLLKMEHEYEADTLAASGDNYHYGHFLLQQALLKGTPSIAHSFHYSPIKNRITMLTRNHKLNKGWKYFAVVPALLCCTLIMAKSADRNQRIRVGDKTTFKGNDFYWIGGAVDSTPVADPVTNDMTWIVTQKMPEIQKMNSDSIYNEYSLDITTSSVKPQFRYQQQSIHDYLKDRLKKTLKQLPDSLSRIDMNNVVLDKNGKVVYFDIISSYVKKGSKNGTTGEFFSSSLENDPTLLNALDKIIEDSPAWMPGIINGKSVPCFLAHGAVIEFKPTVYVIQSIAPVK